MLRYIDWIWHVSGSVALAPGQSSDDAFDRLEPLFQQAGTSHERASDTLTFRKQDQAAQDKMSIFDHGVLRIDGGGAGSMLRYRLASRALLFCFLAPLLFLAFAEFTLYLGKVEPQAKAASAHGKELHPPKKPAPSKPAPKHAVPMNPIDKALGAPAPEKPGKGDARGEEEHGKKPSPTPAYVFAAIFATLYVVGRILEDRLVKALFTKRLLSQ